jgi:hypothetical protein
VFRGRNPQLAYINFQDSEPSTSFSAGAPAWAIVPECRLTVLAEHRVVARVCECSRTSRELSRLVVCPREVVDALKRREASESAVRTEAIVEVER